MPRARRLSQITSNIALLGQHRYKEANVNMGQGKPESSLLTKGKYFVSGYFEATEEGKGQIPATAAGQSFFRNPGQLGGQIYADLDFIYKISNNLYSM